MLLLDEPLGALDLKLRRQMQIELKRIQTEVGITFVHVTHDQEEAMTMADTVAVMNEGVIEQMGEPADLYENPRDHLRRQLPRPVQPGGRRGRRHRGRRPRRRPARHACPGDRAAGRHLDQGDVLLGVRPEKMLLGASGHPAPTPGQQLRHRGRVTDVSFIGVSTQYLVRMPWGQELMVFAQNTGADRSVRRATRSTCTGGPSTPSCSTPPRTPPPGLDARTRADDRQRRPPPASAVPTKDGAKEKRKGLFGYLLLLPGSVWLLIFFVVPLVTLVSTSLYDPSGSLETGYADDRLLAELHARRSRTTATRSSAPWCTPRSATVPCMLLGYPLAYAIAFKAGRWKNLMLVAVIAPFFTVVPGAHAVVAAAPRRQRPRRQHAAVRCTCSVTDGRLLATPIAVVTGLTYNFLPFMVLPLYASLEKIDHRLIEAGADLYATPLTTFRKVTLPLSMPGLVAGTLLTFIPSAGDYINAELLGSPQTQMIGNVIQYLFNGSSYPEAAALSVTLMAVIVVLVLVYIRRAGTEELRVSGVRRDGSATGWCSASGCWCWSTCSLPIAVVILMSFNHPATRNSYHVRRLHAGELAQPLRPPRACAPPSASACGSACSPPWWRPCSAR